MRNTVLCTMIDELMLRFNMFKVFSHSQAGLSTAAESRLNVISIIKQQPLYQSRKVIHMLPLPQCITVNRPFGVINQKQHQLFNKKVLIGFKSHHETTYLQALKMAREVHI